MVEIILILLMVTSRKEGSITVSTARLVGYMNRRSNPYVCLRW